MRGRALCAASLLLALAPRVSLAAPDPVLATALSAASTLVPIAATTSLWATGRGIDEGVRFDLGMVFLGLGAIAGPSIGQFYAEGGTNAVLSLILRTITGGVMLGGIGLIGRGGESGQDVGTALTLIGGIPTALLALYDIIDASDTAIEARRRRATAMVIAPPTRSVGPFDLCASIQGGCPL